MTYTFKALIIAAVGATALIAQTTGATAGDRSPGDNIAFASATSATSTTKKNTVTTFTKTDTQTRTRVNAAFLLQK